MRVLQLCHKPPRPSIDGGCLAMDALTQGMLANDADVKVVTASTSKHPIRMDDLGESYLTQTRLEAVQIETQFDLRDAYISFLNRDSYNISRFYAHHYSMVVKKVLSRKRYDVVHLESLYMTPYIETIRRHAPNALVSMRSHNHEYQIWEQRWKSSKNPFNRVVLRHLSKTLERYEKEILNDVDVVVAISQKEANGYRDWGYQGPIHVSGFGIDVSETAPDVDEKPVPQPGKIRMFHLGAMDWGPNVEGVNWFVHDVWPQLIEQHPNIELHLAGKGLMPMLYEELPGVFNHGEVEDAAAFSSQFDLLVVPLLRGAGIRVKIVESMAKGIPVATTSKGALGLDMEGDSCLIHAEPNDFGEALTAIINHPSRLLDMRTKAKTLVRERFDRNQIGKDLLKFYQRHVQL